MVLQTHRVVWLILNWLNAVIHGGGTLVKVVIVKCTINRPDCICSFFFSNLTLWTVHEKHVTCTDELCLILAQLSVLLILWGFGGGGLEGVGEMYVHIFLRPLFKICPFQVIFIATWIEIVNTRCQVAECIIVFSVWPIPVYYFGFFIKLFWYLLSYIWGYLLQRYTHVQFPWKGIRIRYWMSRSVKPSHPIIANVQVQNIVGSKDQECLLST